MSLLLLGDCYDPCEHPTSNGVSRQRSQPILLRVPEDIQKDKMRPRRTRLASPRPYLVGATIKPGESLCKLGLVVLPAQQLTELVGIDEADTWLIGLGLFGHQPEQPFSGQILRVLLKLIPNGPFHQVDRMVRGDPFPEPR